MTMQNVQNCLSRFQATPLIGPFIGSPLKALLSAAELVTALALSVIFGALFTVTGNKTLGDWTMSMNRHVGLGITGLIYSVVNFLSLGLIGHRVENLNAPAAL